MSGLTRGMKVFAANGARRNTPTGNIRMQTKEDREFVEKIKTIGGFVRGGTPRFHNTHSEHLSTMSSGVLKETAKDPIRWRHIRSGNASDKVLKRDAEAINREFATRPEREWKEKKLKKIKAMKARYKARYGHEP